MIKRGVKIDVEKFLKKEVSEEERLRNYINALEKTFERLKVAYEKKDAEEFNILKKTMINLHRSLLNERPK